MPRRKSHRRLARFADSLILCGEVCGEKVCQNKPSKKGGKREIDLPKLKALSLVTEELKLVEEKMHRAAEEAYGPMAAAFLKLVSSGGKRLRPTLVILSSKFYQEPDLEKLIAMGAAVETLHTATLIHDDLIDEATIRRGLPTLTALWRDRGMIVLAGDYVFAQSAAMAAETEDIRIVKMFAETLMTICDGELRQGLSLNQWDQPKEAYYRRIYAKTASLFTLATQSGAILSHAPEEGIQALEQYGRYLGMAFQVMDDILDFTGNEKKLGKPVGNDLREGVVTLPTYYYIQQDPSRKAEVSAVLASNGEERKKAVAALVKRIAESSAIGAAYREAVEMVGKAKAALDVLPDNVYRQALAELADYSVKREV